VHVYAIMPVGSDPAYVWKREALQRVAARHGCSLHLPLEKAGPSGEFDLLRALQDIAEARFVLVDLSLERPSCYYEMGLAQSLHKRTVLIACAGTPIHQAYGRNGVRFFDDEASYASLLDELLADEDES
jgi:hypothetical protein